MKTYCYSINEENFYGDYATPEEAAMDGMDPGKPGENAQVWVGEKREPDMSCPVDGDHLIEDLLAADDFQIEAAEVFFVSREERANLTERLNAMWSEWIKANNITPGFFNVENVTEWTLQFQNENGEPEEDMSERGKLVPIRVTKA